MTRTLVLALTTLALAACDASPAPKPFNYDLTSSSKIDIEAHDGNGGPIRGVVVSVRAPAIAPDLTGPLLWMGATGSDGHARAMIRTDGAGDALDVTLHKAGWRGPWTNDAMRVSQGVTAPSSRQIIPIAESDSLSVDLERTP